MSTESSTTAEFAYKIETVEPIRLLSKEARKQALIDSGYNPFGLKSREVYIDLHTDSGTGALSQDQWAALMIGEGSRSFEALTEAVREVFCYEHFVPTRPRSRFGKNYFPYSCQTCQGTSKRR